VVSGIGCFKLVRKHLLCSCLVRTWMQSSNFASLNAERCSNLHCYTSCPGCGHRSADYDWSSSNPAVATVTIDGVVQTKGLGRTVIRATALGDVLNDDEVCNY